jgi:hypothetical protein
VRILFVFAANGRVQRKKEWKVYGTIILSAVLYEFLDFVWHT